MHLFELLLALVAASVALALLAERLRLPYAVVLVVGGMALAFVPGLPTVRLDPGLALALFLPPFLQLSAQRTDWQAFRGALRPILLLALGAVLFTALLVAIVARAMVPDMPWSAAIALGAIVAPPDAVAAAAVLKESRIPKSINTVLEGESLLNDASSLVLYRFAVVATMAGTFSWTEAGASFLLSAAGGAVIGWIVGQLAIQLFQQIENSLLETTVSILCGFAAYLGAEQFHVSGVLAAVASGLVIGRNQHRVFSARSRLESNAVWNFVEFVLTSFVFVLIGLQLRELVARLVPFDGWALFRIAASVSAVLIVGRFLWVFPTAWLPRVLFPRGGKRVAAAPTSHVVVVAWAGMRGVVSLAAALALPAAFPYRDLIVFLAFCAILATLVLQGTTLGPLIRLLGVGARGEVGDAVREARLRRKLAAAELDAVVGELSDQRARPAARDLIPEYRARALHAARAVHDTEQEGERRGLRHDVRLRAIAAARALLGEHQLALDTERLRVIEEELDHRETQMRVGDES